MLLDYSEKTDTHIDRQIDIHLYTFYELNFITSLITENKWFHKAYWSMTLVTNVACN